MAGFSLVSMYVLMYAMVDRGGNVFNNLNQFYMAGLMASSMVIIELVLMKDMYDNYKINAVLATASAVALIPFFILIRQQTAISDQQFLRSMIPHHGAAILMCEQAPVRGPRVKEPCKSIIASQQSEIVQMKSLLQAY